MVKNLSGLVHTVEGKVYNFICDHDAPLSHVKEALFQFMGQVTKIEDTVKANAENKAAESQPCSETPVVETPSEIVE